MSREHLGRCRAVAAIQTNVGALAEHLHVAHPGQAAQRIRHAAMLGDDHLEKRSRECRA